MSQISAFNPTADELSPASTPSRFQEMTSEDFVRIIFTELSNQDPFQPSDTGALLEQLNSIRSIESDIKLTEQLESLVLENQLSSASGLIGKLVSGISDANDRVAGMVTAIIREGDNVSMELEDGTRMPLDNIETIVDPRLVADQPPTPAPPAAAV